MTVWRLREKTVVYKSRREASKGTNPADPPLDLGLLAYRSVRKFISVAQAAPAYGGPRRLLSCLPPNEFCPRLREASWRPESIGMRQGSGKLPCATPCPWRLQLLMDTFIQSPHGLWMLSAVMHFWTRTGIELIHVRIFSQRILNAFIHAWKMSLSEGLWSSFQYRGISTEAQMLQKNVGYVFNPYKVNHVLIVPGDSHI